MTFQGFEQSPGGLVSVIIVNWNRRALLESCLRSLAREQGVEFEIIVVDNGSTDGSRELVQTFIGGQRTVRLIQNPDNRGFCEANNQGIAAARGEFVALLNNDAEAEPMWLAHLLAAFTQADVGMAASKILVWRAAGAEGPPMIDKVGHLIYPDGQNRGRGSGELDTGQYDTIEETLWPDGCACMYRKAMLDEIGGFDEDLFAYGDDADLGLRARIAGWRSLYMPAAVVWHHRGSSMGKQNPGRITLIERNRVLLAVKLFPGSLLCLNGAYYLARIFAAALAAVRNRGEIGHFSSPWLKLRAAWALCLGDLQALSMVPMTLRKRRRILAERKLSSSQTRRLLLRFRIPLRQLTDQSAQLPR